MIVPPMKFTYVFLAIGILQYCRKVPIACFEQYNAFLLFIGHIRSDKIHSGFMKAVELALCRLAKQLQSGGIWTQIRTRLQFVAPYHLYG